MNGSHFKVFSMFDGVGGFGIGLSNANKDLGLDLFQTAYTDQFEPSRKSQDAFEVELFNTPDIQHLPYDIQQVPDSMFQQMRAEGVNFIVGGFPCQDYSVARSKKYEQGIEGKKGVLFWEIIRAVRTIQPQYLILENVDRLLKSPSKQRGRDFAIMLGAFNQLDYSVEWRVINAADYGRAQRRRRVFFFVYKNSSEIGTRFGSVDNAAESEDYLLHSGLFARQFPVENAPRPNREFSRQLSDKPVESDDYLLDISDNFNSGDSKAAMWNSGIMRNGWLHSIDTIPQKCQPITLGEIVDQAEKYYVEKFGGKAYADYIQQYVITDAERLKKFEYLRGPKKITRTSAEGHHYLYSEGGMSPHDDLDLPARTMLTSEGSVNRSTHLLKIGEQFRTLTPIEAELLQDFPPDWTRYKLVGGDHAGGEPVEVTDTMRYFFMGNALVTGIVRKIGVGVGTLLCTH